MSQKHALVSWERYQQLLDIERKNLESPVQSQPESQNSSLPPCSPEVSTASQPDQDPDLQPEPAVEDQSPGGDQSPPGVSEVVQRGCGDLKPPGIPVQGDQRWLVW